MDPGSDSVVYSGRQNDADSGGPTTWQSGNPCATFNYGIPGTFEIQAIVHYPSNSSGAKERYVTLPLRSVTIPRPVISQVVGPGIESPYGGTRDQAPPANSTNPTATSLNG